MSRTILITGAGRGIGRAMTEQLLASGATVHATARSDAALADLSELGAITHRVDVTRTQDISALKQALGDTPLDVLINNAGIIGPDRQNPGDVDIDGWRLTMEVNMIAPYLVTDALADNVAASDEKKVVIISSRMGSVSETTSPDRMVYRSSKAAVNMVAQCMALTLQPRGVNLIPVHPGWVSTDMGGSAAPVTPAESAAGILKLVDRMGPDMPMKLWNFAGDSFEF